MALFSCKGTNTTIVYPTKCTRAVTTIPQYVFSVLFHPPSQQNQIPIMSQGALRKENAQRSYATSTGSKLHRTTSSSKWDSFSCCHLKVYNLHTATLEFEDAFLLVVISHVRHVLVDVTVLLVPAYNSSPSGLLIHFHINRCYLLYLLT